MVGMRRENEKLVRKIKNEVKTIKQKINEFIRSLKFKEITKKSYFYDLNDFRKYLEKREIDYLNIESSMQQEIIDKYLRNLKENKSYQAKTVNRRCISLDKFNNYLGIEGVKAKYLKIQKQIYLEDIITQEEVKKILAYCKDKRDRAIFIALGYTGVRVSELLKIELKDINSKEIDIEGKYSKHRKVFLSKDLRVALKEYSIERPKSKEKKLFLNHAGKVLTRQGIDYIIKKYARKSHIQIEKAHAHNFRHMFCKSLVDKNVPLNKIADLAGHDNIQTTRIYTVGTKKDLENTIADTFNFI